MKAQINKFLAKFNYTIKRVAPKDPQQYFLNHLSEELAARQILLKYFQISTLLDVGANAGQYASLMRKIGYDGRIISFEPLNSAYKQLKEKTKNDKNWSCMNYALGAEIGKSVIHVSKNSFSSSIFDILPSHIEFDKDSEYIADQEIEIKTLDSIFDQFCHPNDRVFLKIDTQGFEMNILKGATESLLKIDFIQLEMSIEPLYSKETLFPEMFVFLMSKGFELFTFENGIRNSMNGKLLQIDGIFINKTIYK